MLWPLIILVSRVIKRIEMIDSVELFSISFRFVQAVHLIGNYYSLETVKLNTVVSTLRINIIENESMRCPQKRLAIGCLITVSSLEKVKMDILRTPWIPFYCQACLRCFAQILSA